MNWKNLLISPKDSILHALKIIDRGGMQIALVADERHVLKGTVTDGDIRRGILRGVSLEECIELVMNANPIVGYMGESREQLVEKMQLSAIRHVPVLNHDGHIVYIEMLNNLMPRENKDNCVVIMAGGLGTRLRPLTENCPKPLLKVGGKPLLETIIQNFKDFGFRKFYLSVNYKAEMIENYFGNGSRFGVQIEYIHENKRMGTAGALGLLPTIPQKPFIVMNGDLLTKVNFNQLLDFHKQNNAIATMCLRDYEFQVPYGVIEVDKHRLIGIKEKPSYRYFVNAGIYVLDPEALKHVPKDTFYDMPSLFELLIQKNFETAAFPLREYWMDIGRLDDFEQANGEYSEVFGA